jgi:hypothetical protein
MNEVSSRVHIGKHLPATFPINDGLKQGDSLSLLLFNFIPQFAIRKGWN